MKNYKSPLVSIAILDFNRPKEAELLLKSLEENANFEYELVYVSNGGKQDYVLDFYNNNRIDTLLMNKKGSGCGLGTRQAFQTCLAPWVIYVQVDQFLQVKLEQNHIEQLISHLENNPNCFYIDLAGNQGNGQFSERALLINRKRYLSIPNLDNTIGGPGPWANYQWTENLVQEYMKRENLGFISTQLVFANNGKWSHRNYPCGGETLHATDTKQLFIVEPLKQRYDDFPNLKLTDSEWEEVLSGCWPVEGKIPKADEPHSFLYWRD